MSVKGPAGTFAPSRKPGTSRAPALTFKQFLRQLTQPSEDCQEGAPVLPTTIAETILALNPRAIQGLGSSMVTTISFLRTLEEAQLPGISMRYVLVHDEIGPVGFTVFSVVSLDGQKMLQSGHPLIWGQHFCLFRGRDPTPSVVASILGAAYRIRRLENLPAAVLKDFSRQDLAYGPALTRHGYACFPAAPTALIPVRKEWRSMGDYLQRLPPRARKALRDKRRAFEKAELAIEASRPTPIAGELCELYAQSTSARFPQGKALTQAFFCTAEQHLREDFRLWIIRRGNHLQAFAVAIVDRNVQNGRNHLIPLLVAAGAQEDRERHLRSNLLMHIIEEAIRGGFEGIELNPQDASLHQEFAAATQPAYCFIRHQKPVADLATRTIFEGFVAAERFYQDPPAGLKKNRLV